MKIVNLTESDEQQIVLFIMDEFIYSEPCYRALNPTRQDAEAVMSLLVKTWLKTKVSFMIVNSDNNDAIVGICLNTIQIISANEMEITTEEKELNQLLADCAQPMRIVEHFLSEIDKGTYALLKDVHDTQVRLFHIELICIVHSYRGKGIHLY
jgi:hypothetical protein